MQRIERAEPSIEDSPRQSVPTWVCPVAAPSWHGADLAGPLCGGRVCCSACPYALPMRMPTHAMHTHARAGMPQTGRAQSDAHFVNEVAGFPRSQMGATVGESVRGQRALDEVGMLVWAPQDGGWAAAQCHLHRAWCRCAGLLVRALCMGSGQGGRVTDRCHGVTSTSMHVVCVQILQHPCHACTTSPHPVCACTVTTCANPDVRTQFFAQLHPDMHDAFGGNNALQIPVTVSLQR